ncbi:hypothetical protein [Xylophilus sp. ASV27]|uniref:hypothetical protein n=1 Tax=Xylophilus sp. ASV27 TaxID=2795129 RepID=UPI0018EE2A0E|nr:hypothetical protein [Xylophilus sp. ASV27]
MSDIQSPDKSFNWAKFQAHLGYTDEEMAEFRADDRRRKAAEAIPAANRRTIVATVMSSHGCAAGFKVGDTIEVSGAGVVKSCNVCIYAVAPMTIHAAMAHDRIAEGLDPNGMWFNTFSCQDGGFCNGSWGQVCFKVCVE